MSKFITLASLACVVALIALCTAVCSEPTDTPTPTSAPEHTTQPTETAEIEVVTEKPRKTEKPVVPTEEPEIDYSEFIPKVSFGNPLLSFAEDNGRTYLYTEVKYDDMKKYNEKLLDMGYRVMNKEASRKKDTYTASYKNDETGVKVNVKYAVSGLTIQVIRDK